MDNREFKSSGRAFSTGEKYKAAVVKDEVKKSDRSSVSNKWAAIRAYRKANGLCYICGEKWCKKHKCPDQVPINAIQEIMEMFQLDATSDEASSSDDSDEEDMVLAVQPTPVPAQPQP